MNKHISPFLYYSRKIYIYIVIIFFILLVSLNYRNFLTVNKYLSEFGIKKLFTNYHLFLTDFPSFLTKTISLHEGDTQSAWSSFYFLLPLFLFLKSTGGLCLKNLYFFNFAVSIANLVVFYKVCEYAFKRQVAQISVLYLVFSAWFFEFTMSYSYCNLTFLISLILIYVMFRCLKEQKIINYLFLGVVIGVSMYFYGTIRYLWLPVVMLIFNRKFNSIPRIIYFLIGLTPLLVFSLSGTNFKKLFDEENIFWAADPGAIYSSWLLRLSDNLKSVFKAFAGGYIEIPHAHLMNALLVVPFIWGMVWIIKKRKINSYNLLLWIFIAITVLPAFITYAHTQPRRFVLYPVPMYMLIGIGMRQLVKRACHINMKMLRILSICLILCASVYIIMSEFNFIRSSMTTNKRDFGFIKLSKELSTSLIHGKIYYLQEVPHRLYGDPYDCEKYLLMLALGDYRSDFSVTQINSLDNLAFEKEIYIVKSPLIQEDYFQDILHKQGFSFKELFASPFSGNFIDSDNGFRVYKLQK